jgi:hypothetical protein
MRSLLRLLAGLAHTLCALASLALLAVAITQALDAAGVIDSGIVDVPETHGTPPSTIYDNPFPHDLSPAYTPPPYHPMPLFPQGIR